MFVELSLYLGVNYALYPSHLLFPVIANTLASLIGKPVSAETTFILAVSPIKF